ncbi:triphosphoribosyl-dephospho-CoA synthase MdcB [Stenotrophomonas maltophilia]|uniref:triphosphoribosyl-dephospho-CoA synthase MdcB n=1 Tax=Stenotrophomonas maltophilia TaxID=40324 RepID=UPI000C2595E1|nr:triphosphoribosyl-dephospho-CoA synthase MdcB [Stenotrophomonas maltophilia]MCU1069183.1 triphosphoribosyl-dephospho-CoA synthase MdcB [Stenotrophomonas maltophilia]MCU1074288.1 triphosphoribosyl-dephospho-CoA synthase MdcB [Stenotrophomonas maltophilia]MCU1138125.1 triphosphoribosyl-dephospho-CoA synthase MdcB [Stenotrophomonas maltophilia]PJL57896.1 triphosphoribosyl-dephospho-CoA synthase MdcB [Stenotrophomonas maltophilia]
MNTVAQPTVGPAAAVDCARLGRLAVASLHAELALAPKPGLVTPFDRGSHHDMDAGTFLRSLFALRHYFTAVAHLGAAGADFDALRRCGIAAEAAMLRATAGINTHRGAVFSLGLLVAAAAACRSRLGHAATGEQACLEVRRWAADLARAPLDAASPGQRARTLHKVPGVREQAAAGYPLLREVALPSLRHALASGLPREAAMCHTLMQLVAHTEDLNLLHRGGAEGLRWARQQAHRFLAEGGAFAHDWQPRLQRIADAFVARHLSPGGSADLLACSLFLLQQEGT